MVLRMRAFGLALGTFWGFAILFITWWLLLWGEQGETMQLLGNVYRGYHYSYDGAFFGLLWGFITGFITGVIIAWLYNLFSKKLYKSKQ